MNIMGIVGAVDNIRIIIPSTVHIIGTIILSTPFTLGSVSVRIYGRRRV